VLLELEEPKLVGHGDDEIGVGLAKDLAVEEDREVVWREGVRAGHHGGHPQGEEDRWEALGVLDHGGNVAHGSQMVQQTTGSAVWRVDRAQKAPRFGKKLAHSGGPELREESSSMHTAEVGEVPQEIQLFSDDTVSRSLAKEGRTNVSSGTNTTAQQGREKRKRKMMSCLLEIETCVGDEVSSGEEVLHLLANVGGDLQQSLLECGG